MIKLLLILLTTMPYAHAEEPVNYIKHRTWYSGLMGLDDYFLIRKIKYSQDYYYIMNPAEMETSDGKAVHSGVVDNLLADNSKTLFSIKEEELSACLNDTENKVSMFFPSISEPKALEMTTEEHKNVFKCFCKVRPDKLDEHGLLYKIEKKFLDVDYVYILYCRKGQTTEEEFLDEIPIAQIAKFKKKIRW